jgi:hypothetical protein
MGTNHGPNLFISLTRLQLRSYRFIPQFLWINEKAVKQLISSPGFVEGKLLLAGPRQFWTVTVWTDENSMRKYRGTGAHLKAMGKLAGWCDEASVAHWKQTSETIPDWETLRKQMQASGRRSRVNHPSREHVKEPWTLPAPRWRLERPVKGVG